jgi:prophage regulatory protein
MNYPKVVRMPEVLDLLKISRSNLYQKVNQGLWPKPIQLGLMAVAWLKTENEQVIATMIDGQSADEIKLLVQSIEDDRKQMNKFYCNKKPA